MPVVDARSFRDRIAPGEAKEQLGGFIMIDVPDLNETIRIASRIPAGRIGSVEVRPIKEGGGA
jgi:hypothetical protein